MGRGMVILFRINIKMPTYTFSNNLDEEEFLFEVQTRFGNNVQKISNNGNTTILTSSNLLTNYEVEQINNIYNIRISKEQNLYSLYSACNSTINPLLSNQVFTGGFEDVSQYTMVNIKVLSDQSSASNGIETWWSSNLTTSNVILDGFNSNEKKNIYLNAYNNRYFKLVYKNGNVSQSNFRLKTHYVKHYSNIKDEYRVINDQVTDIDKCDLTRSIVTGKYFNIYNNVGVNNEGRMNINVPFSAFGLLKTEQDVPVIQIDYVYGTSDAIVNVTTSNIGSYFTSNSILHVNSGSNANSFCSVSSRRFLKYKAGQGANIMFTGMFANGIIGNTQLMGIGTVENGYFFGYDGSNFGVLQRQNSFDIWTYQDQWNIDRMDGRGSSGNVVIPQFGNVYRISFQWLGFGAITFFIEETNTGEFLPVHKIAYANKNTTPSVLNPSFPMRIESKNITNATNVQLRACCFAAMVEGARSFLGQTFGVDNTKIITSSTSITNVLTIRNKTNYKANLNFIPVFLRLLSVGSDGNKNSVVYLIRQATLGGIPVYTDVYLNESVVEYDTSGTLVTDGFQIAAFSFGKLESRTQSLNELDVFLDPGQTLTIGAKLVGTGSTEISCSLTWIEDR